MRPSVDTAAAACQPRRRQGVRCLKEAGADGAGRSSMLDRFAAALACEDLAELVADEKVDDEVDRRVDGQQDIGDAVGAQYERIDVDAVVVACDEPAYGDQQSQHGVRKLTDEHSL